MYEYKLKKLQNQAHLKVLDIKVNEQCPQIEGEQKLH